MSHETIGQRIAQARKRAHFTLEGLGEMLGVSPQAIHGWEIDASGPQRKRLSAIADALGVTEQWLLTGVADYPLADLDDQIPSGRSVPRYAFAGIRTVMQDTTVLNHTRTAFPCGPRSFATLVPDGDNAPTISAGDNVVIDPDRTPRPGTMVLALVGPDRTPTIGRMATERRDGQLVIRIEKINPLYAHDEIASEADGVIIGTITETSRSLAR